MKTVSIGSADETLCVGMVPGRKRPSLYLQRGGTLFVLASFRDDGAAGEAVDFFESLSGKHLTTLTPDSAVCTHGEDS